MTVFIGAPRMTGGQAFHRTESEPFRFDMHRHDLFGELLLVEKGAGVFDIGGTAVEASEGTLLFYEKGTWHKEKSVKHPFQALYISFDRLRVQGLGEDRFFIEGAVTALRLGEHYPAIRASMRECVDAFYGPEPEARTIADHLLGILFAKLARIVHYAGSSAPPSRAIGDAVLVARRHMEEHYRDPITLERLAEVAFVNKYHLAHSFKERLGQSPIQFLIRYRMEVACHYLRETDRPIAAIAEAVGYQSEPSFFHAFRKAVGMTPRQYREGGDESR
ncbi:helix-turn-helix domain-containing protein [Cohnella sp. GCM10027633]|uniref:helix-turn-helix domain-containing protein n=1 Tax=unclassified Cohnella TaxID=2636738 RepID=UPI00362CE9BB